MGSIIRVLDDQTINKIAAGEVIENPASVIKELVENSLDAQSTEIIVEITSGGYLAIRIQDNGVGMIADDALLAIERHATSKIKKVEDLDSLSTMGFRGEALPSIASISKFTLTTTSQKNPESGFMVCIEGGKLLYTTKTQRSPGTTIEVKNLFFNVPARKKFQESAQSSLLAITKCLHSLALAHPQIKFSLIHNNTTVFNFPGFPKIGFQEGLLKRIQQIFGDEYANNMMPLSSQQGPYLIEGFLGSPEIHRPNRTGQFIYINQRPVQSKTISQGVLQGFGTRIPQHRYPIFILFVSCSGLHVDVNVHPQKKEIRFQNDFEIQTVVSQSVNLLFQNQTSSYTPLEFKEETKQTPPQSYPHNVVPTKIIPDAPYPQPVIKEKSSFTPFSYRPSSFEGKISKNVPNPSLFHNIPEKASTDYVCIECFDHLIVASRKYPSQELLFIDTKAAQRALAELKTKSDKWNDNTQHLLIPILLTIEKEYGDILKSHLKDFEDSGIKLTENSSCEFVIESVPSILQKFDIKSLVKDFIYRLSSNKVINVKEEIRLFFEQYIQNKEEKLPTPKTIEEGNLFLNEMFKYSLPSFCPKGHLILKKMDLNNFNDFMKRV